MTHPQTTLIDNPAGVAAAAPAGVVLCPQALAVLAQLDPSGANQLFVRVMTTYCKSLARLVAQMVAARQPLDAAALRLATHTLKSSSASIGARALSEICGSAEAALRDGRLDDLSPMLDALLAEAEQVDIAVRQLLLPS